MADVLLLLAALVIVLCGTAGYGRIHAVARKKKALRARLAEQLSAASLADIDSYIRRVDAATTMEELRNLEKGAS